MPTTFCFQLPGMETPLSVSCHHHQQQGMHFFVDSALDESHLRTLQEIYASIPRKLRQPLNFCAFLDQPSPDADNNGASSVQGDGICGMIVWCPQDISPAEALHPMTFYHECAHVAGYQGDDPLHIGGSPDPHQWETLRLKDRLENPQAPQRLFSSGIYRRVICPDSEWVSDYGIGNPHEDWAESVMLYLHDLRRGSRQFMSLFPHRAQYIAAWLAA